MRCPSRLLPAEPIKKASGKDTKRPQLDALLTFVRAGNTVVVHSMDQLARKLGDLRHIVQVLTKRGVRIEFVPPPQPAIQKPQLPFDEVDKVLRHCQKPLWRSTRLHP
jgi:hypothetical protein